MHNYYQYICSRPTSIIISFLSYLLTYYITNYFTVVYVIRYTASFHYATKSELVTFNVLSAAL